MRDERRRRRVPMGRPIAWTDDEIEQLSLLSTCDIAAAREWAHERFPARYRTLLDAELTTEGESDE